MKLFPNAPIGAFLVAIVIAAIAPILIFVVLVLQQLEDGQQEALERRALRDARSLASSTNQLLRDMAANIRLVASAPELAAGDLQSFHNRTQSALRHSSLYVILVEEDGQQLLNTRVPFGTQLGHTSHMKSLAEALESQQLTVSDVFFGQTSKQWVFNVLLPTPPETMSGDALIITRNAAEIASLISTDSLPEDWSAAILDSTGHVVASVGPDQAETGEVFDERLLDSFESFSGVARVTIDGEKLLSGYTGLPGWSWTAVAWGPIGSGQEAIRETWLSLILGGLLLLLVAVVAAYFVARQIRKSIIGIAGMANEMGEGRIVAPINTPVREIDTVAKALSTASFDRSQAEDQIRLIMRELAHRTKNQLSLVQAAIRQTARNADTIEDFNRSIDARISGLGRSVDLLTSEQWAAVPLETVIRSQMEFFGDITARLDTSGQTVLLKPEATQNLGLILHELATNAVKYGAWSVPTGRVSIEWDIVRHADKPEDLEISWLESGGPPAVEPTRKGFGSQVVVSHAQAVFWGAVKTEYGEKGFHWKLVAPLASFVGSKDDDKNGD